MQRKRRFLLFLQSASIQRSYNYTRVEQTSRMRCVFFAMLNEAAVHWMPALKAALIASGHIVAGQADTAKE
jgi:hypothetical protein